MRFVEDRNFYKTAVEIPFIDTDPFHLKLTDLIQRVKIEEVIAAALKERSGMDVRPEHVIIDIPEPISFEINLPIISGDRILNYPDTATVFTNPVISRFSRVLRSIRLILPEELSVKIRDPEIYLSGKILD